MMAGQAALLLACLILSAWSILEIRAGRGEQVEYTETFRSPAFSVGPGDVIDKYYYIQMPEGHVALRGMDAQIVDENGTPIPLSETYVHHWLFLRYNFPESLLEGLSQTMVNGSRPELVPNDGVCARKNGLVQWFGLGSETRRTNTTIPPPYGIPIGDPAKIPVGDKETWLLNIHAIDSRGAVDPRGCTECLCALYGVTVDAFGRNISEDYKGGLHCCYDGTHCALKPGFNALKRQLFVEYTVRWVPMDEDVLPLRVYVLDVTDSKSAIDENDDCQVEYTVDKCAEGGNECVLLTEASAFLPESGDLIYAVAHQHTGGIGSTLYHENGAEICESIPIYGEGSEAGNESGFIVGMNTCYPEPGTVRIEAGERLHLKSWYNNEQQHTGVMGLFYLLVADSKSPPPEEGKGHLKMALGTFAIAAVALLVGISIHQHYRRRDELGYEPIA